MIHDELENSRVWFITGTSGGMGYALAKAALQQGDRVAATARNSILPKELATRFPGCALAIELDVREEATADRAAEQAVEAFGRIDIVFNNAGFATVGSAEGTTDKQVREMFDTGFFGVLNVLRATLPVLRQQRSGHVLQMSSIFGHMSFPATGVIAAAKQSVGAITQAMAQELGPMGIKFTQIEPGGLNTQFLAKWISSENEYPDYDTAVGPVLQLLRNLPDEAVADIDRVAAAILEVVAVDDPPMHLALGSWAERIIRKELTDRLADLDSWAALTRSVD
ncbi:SDR family oxidoreductase [Kribbella qitaiheensis]|uniref:SDR family oxidoreductase n=1 Tax=Kribbella qitaiheensis TaxID=1544730 RepID=UPI0036071D67